MAAIKANVAEADRRAEYGYSIGNHVSSNADDLTVFSVTYMPIA